MKAPERDEQIGESKIREAFQAEEEDFHVKPDDPFTWTVVAGKPPQLEIRPSKEKMEQVGIDPEAVPPTIGPVRFQGRRHGMRL